MDEEYRLSALRVRRNVMEVEMAEEELMKSDRFERIQRQIVELTDDSSESPRSP